MAMTLVHFANQRFLASTVPTAKNLPTVEEPQGQY